MASSSIAMKRMSVADVRTDFLDSNVLVYAFSDDPRSAAAKHLLLQRCAIGVQGLNEFAHVARRKLRLPWPKIDVALAAIRAACPTIVPLDIELHDDGMLIASRYGVSVYDGLMLAAARRAGCRIFWSEDLQDNFVVDGTLTVRNPFQ
jgi:predicted nucleic acid-binding protein